MLRLIAIENYTVLKMRIIEEYECSAEKDSDICVGDGWAVRV